ncbi:MAG: hypothetical protein ACC707_16470 [Thiohalomonadales bacterium]
MANLRPQTQRNCAVGEYLTILFVLRKIVDDRLLVAVNPAGQGNYEEMEGLYDIGHRTNKLSVILSDNNIVRFVRVIAP